ncbi:N-acetylmuramoyl-L-alanine amidase [Paenibacillus sp. UNCCL117]|uniref:N-acetylmuramoyl-L-alanine amidase n=1 Tax=unclassified Paenibacillus TaxID=185978 RepID=UPI000890A94A|nr:MULTISPECIES: N-acetylmuramoyl-L-alanine amidase [unclassified Paenibacillus]SDD29297.1 N-acetylmuramoyl-L-alanine amidase [Paenibacillus sp. cl123]SFW40749.1 N-acetylmuramoyl-L-alanine amidase [Paenibacillus sp. UNCCL117]
MKLIALDNGHGAQTAGKRTPVFPDSTPVMREWEFNRRVVQLLKIELERCGFRTIEVSPGEADTDLMLRTKRANDAGADFYLSVHANAAGGNWSSANGIETLTAVSGDGLRIGKVLQRYLVQATGLRDRGIKDGTWLAVVKYTKMPAALVECGFMDNLTEARLLISETYRQTCAVALAKGLCEAYGVSYVPDAPEPEPDDRMLDEGVARTVIDTWISKSWFDTSSAELRDRYHWLADELRYASGILLPHKSLAGWVADTIISTWMSKSWHLAYDAGSYSEAKYIGDLADALRIAAGLLPENQ